MAIILCNPRFGHNVGAVIRAAACYGEDAVYWTGERIDVETHKGKRLPREERMKGYANVDRVNTARPFDLLEEGVIPIAIELTESAEQLQDFEHPEKAAYVFGPEDGSIPKGIRVLCHRFVVIPTLHCTNLAAAVYTVLYDRKAKRIREGLDPRIPTIDLLAEDRGFIDGS
jgi:tRNA(Leu) C34 or U34 (ribose-2'-O)-methylase TrmL